jgi:hypothetical protein
MMARASGSGSTSRRCWYQPIASASSVSEAIMRANVRASWLSSCAGSWYCSKPIGRNLLWFFWKAVRAERRGRPTFPEVR